MAAAEESHGAEHAPWLRIPARSVTVVEHPCIVKNLDKGIVSLGGAVKLSQALRSKTEPENPDEKAPDKATLKSAQFVAVSLRPDDPFAKRLIATPVSTNNVLLKVTVPKRTGRKRKCGANGPFVSEAEINASRTEKAAPAKSNNQYVKASTVFRSLKDNAGKYTVVPVGVIDEAHRVRTLPDLQQATYQNRTIREIKENIMPLKWSQLQNFNFNTTPGADLNQNIPLTAEFLQMPVQYNYKFQQNPFVKNTGDERETVNIQKRHTVESYYFIEMDAVSVPTKPRAELPPERTRSANLQEVIASIRAELNKRPIITRQILYNRLGWDKRDRIREAATYCGYFFASGPWREALVKWGVDPRKDPKYRDYQTISFLSFKKIGTARSRFRFDEHVRDLAKKSPDELQNEHIFDGKRVGHTGNIFQFCDITDPMIRKILDTDGVRQTCAPTFQGWYHVGTWAKATVILKDKMNRIIGGETPNPAMYARAMKWPAVWDDQEIYETYRDEMFDRELHRERLDEHTLLNTIRWAAKSPRYAFERLESAKEKLRNANNAIGMDMEQTTEAEVEAEAREGLAEERDDAEALLQEGGEDAEGEDDSGLEDEDEDEGGADKDDEGREEDEDEDEMDVDSDSDEGERQRARPFGGLYGTK